MRLNEGPKPHEGNAPPIHAHRVVSMDHDDFQRLHLGGSNGCGLGEFSADGAYSSPVSLAVWALQGSSGADWTPTVDVK